MRVIIATGVTGGHIFPAIVIAQELTRRKAKIFFVGTKKPLLKKIVSLYKYEISYLNIEPFLGRRIIHKAKILFKLMYSFFKSYTILKEKKPDIIIGTGSATSFPLIIVGKILRLKTMILEQNVIPGLTNQILSYWVDFVCLSFKQSKKYLYCQNKKKKITGNIVREEILFQNKEEAYKKLKFSPLKKTILILGGSQGASIINNIFPECITVLDKEYKNLQVIYLTGERDYKNIEEKVKVENISLIIKPFFLQIELAYAISDLVICRAGATTIAEITACGIPAILIPYKKASFNHQKHNAKVMAEKNAAIIIEEKDLTSDYLVTTILALLKDKEKLYQMSENSKKINISSGREKVLKLIEELCPLC